MQIYIGFGISDGTTAKVMVSLADDVVIGSALVKILYNASRNNENVLKAAASFIQSIRKALDE